MSLAGVILGKPGTLLPQGAQPVPPPATAGPEPLAAAAAGTNSGSTSGAGAGPMAGAGAAAPRPGAAADRRSRRGLRHAGQRPGHPARIRQGRGHATGRGRGADLPARTSSGNGGWPTSSRRSAAAPGPSG